MWPVVHTALNKKIVSTAWHQAQNFRTMTPSEKYWASKQVGTFNVDAYIDEVYNKYAGTPNEETHEDLHQLWNKVLSMPRGGDASLYPNAHGPRPALLEVWHKAGDFWRAGFRSGDTLICDQYGSPQDSQMLALINQCKDIAEAEANNHTDANAEVPTDAQNGPQGDDITADSHTPHPTDETPSQPTNDRSAIDTDTTDTEDPWLHPTPADDDKKKSAFIRFFSHKVTKGIGLVVATFAVWHLGIALPFAIIGGMSLGFIK